MYEDELRRVGDKIEKLHQKGGLKGRPLVFFGVSENTRQMIKIVELYGYRATCVIDNDLTRYGSYCARVLVKAVSELCEDEKKGGVFFIYSYFWREMRLQLLEMGVDEDRIHSFFIADKTLEEQFEMAEKGMAICELLRGEIGEIKVFLCPYTGTGDIYLIGTFWNEYLKRQRIDEYIFIVVSKACAKVAMIFDIKNVRQITQIESSYLVEYYKLCGDKTGIKILNDSWWELRANPLQRFRGFKGLYFTEIFRRFVFDFDDEVMPAQPKLKNADGELDDVFADNELTMGNTVVLSPYSNTLSDLPKGFWIGLANRLTERGFDVCTNCGGDETPVRGTSKVFVPLNIAPQFIQKAGFFVGVRSGFCDCISAANAQMVVLYDKRNRFFNCSAYEYFSLKKMGLCNDVIEIEYDTANIDGLKEQVLRIFG